MSLPSFRYHPDPISSGSIKASDVVCDCCRQARRFIYTASVYGKQREVTICPWCIADGNAAKAYALRFSDDYPLVKAGIADDIIREVCERTPGYSSWQQEVWQHHCRDACEFHGDAEPEDLRSLSREALAEILDFNMMKAEHWRRLLSGYQKGGNPAVYKFVCRHCRKPIYCLDFT